MTKDQKINKAIEKLQQLLALAPEEDIEKVRIELAKMIPTDAKASVHPKIGWGYHDDLIQTGTSFKVMPCYATQEPISLLDLYSNLIRSFDAEHDETDKFIEGFDVLINEKPTQIRLGVLPATEMAEKTVATHISFKIIIK